MTVAVTVKVQNVGELVRTLERMEPRKNQHWVGQALLRSAEEVQRLAREKYIIRGGRVRVAGPRGGRGKLTDKLAASDMLTSRSGRLRDSIAVNRGPLPKAVEVESDVVYAGVHETGGPVKQKVRAHTRQFAFGRETKKPFKVKAFTRTLNFPKRAYLAPALEEASKSFGALFVREWERARDE